MIMPSACSIFIRTQDRERSREINNRLQNDHAQILTFSCDFRDKLKPGIRIFAVQSKSTAR